jgi:hypothetical protein
MGPSGYRKIPDFLVVRHCARGYHERYGIVLIDQRQEGFRGIRLLIERVRDVLCKWFGWDTGPYQ